MSNQEKPMSQRLTDVVVAADNLTQTVQDKIGNIDAQVAAKSAEVDQLIASSQNEINTAVALADTRTSDAITEFANSHANVLTSYYDDILHTKQTLAPEVDPNDETQTQWQLVPVTSRGYHIYPGIGKMTKLHTTNCYRYYPGYYESPEKYQLDWSVTMPQFIFANSSATSEQINTEIANKNLSVRGYGGWWDGSAVYDIHAIKIPSLHPYSQLFVRFKNDVVPDRRADGVVAQNVLEFGGNATFAVDRVMNYPHINA